MFDMLRTATANRASMIRADRDVHSHSEGVVVRSLVIGLTAFLTVVDLFATQAILPSLARHYDVTPAAMDFAVNATTMGMAVSGLAVGFFSQHIDRRLGILVSLALLSLPTALLASAPKPDSFHRIAYLPGPLHGVGIHAHPCVSG
jgi:MFS transporter, YNFM family, putative membrane transport protein